MSKINTVFTNTATGRLERLIFLIQREDGALLGIEVKVSHSVSKDDFRAQYWFQENIIKNKKPYICVCY